MQLFSNFNKEVSQVIFGCANSLMNNGGNADEILSRALELGINTFDTAVQYGLSEVSLGNWLQYQDRENIVIITKGCHPDNNIDRVNPQAIEEDIMLSLQNLKTDYIDIYLLHRDDLKVEVGPIVEKLNQLVEDGIIKAFGGSNWTVTRIKEANSYAAKNNLQPFTVSSPNFSLAEQIGDPWGGGAGSVTITGPANKAARAWYRDSGMLVFGYSSLAHGFFSGRLTSENLDQVAQILDGPALKGYYYPENIEKLRRVNQLSKEKGYTISQIALSWILNQRELSVYPIITTTNKNRLESNIKALEIDLTQDEINWLNLE